MRHPHRFVALALISGATLMPLSSARAQPPYSLGQRLTEAEISALSTPRSVEINGRIYRVLSTASSSQGLPLSMVLGPGGVVGQTFHEVVIAELAPQTARQQFANVIAQAAAVQYQEHANISILRFSTLEQAAAALQQIQGATPDVEAGLPINFSRPRLN